MRFPVNQFSIIVRPPPCTARCVLSCTDVTYFISASVAVDRRFNAASKKENNTERISTQLPHQMFPEKRPPPLGL